jgi:hypothetical protein
MLPTPGLLEILSTIPNTTINIGIAEKPRTSLNFLEVVS